MKFLYFTDPHLRKTTPRRRNGSFENDMMEKIAWILLTAQSEGVDFILCGGDLFDVPNPSYSVASKLMKLISSASIPWFHVLGNHEIIGHNPDSYDMGVIGLFPYLEHFRILEPMKFDSTIEIKPVHYRHGVEEISEEWETTSDESIIVAHAMVTPKEVPWLHTTPSQLAPIVSARLVLLGHYHDPWARFVIRGKISPSVIDKLSEGLKELIGSNEKRRLKINADIAEKITLFLNPGSLARIALLSSNLKRTPRALLIEMLNGDIDITSLPVEVARDSEKIFKVRKAEVEKVWKNRIDDFLSAMEEVNAEGIETVSLITNTAKAIAGVDRVDEIPEQGRKVLDYALSMIDRVKTQED